MNFLFDIGHPGHVHLFRNLIHVLKQDGHKVITTVKEIPTAKRLLDAHGIPYISLGHKKDSILAKGFNQLIYNYKLWQIAKKEKIRYGFGSSITLSQITPFSSIKTFIFDDDDDEVEPLFVKFAHPYATWVVSPDALGHQRNGKNDMVYPGYHELAYLHPDRFQPDKTILKDLDIGDSEPYFVLRFVAFKGHHDVGEKGISFEQRRELISYLSKRGRIFITSEREIEPEFEQYRISVPPERIHSLLYYSTMFLGDSQTMTSEAAVLAVPALKCNTFAGKLSIPNELESRYELCYAYQPEDFGEFLNKAKQLLEQPNLKADWVRRRDKMLKDKVDVTVFQQELIKNYCK